MISNQNKSSYALSRGDLFRWEVVLLVGFFLHGLHSRFTYLYYSRDGKKSNFLFFFNYEASLMLILTIFFDGNFLQNDYHHINALHVDRSSYMHGFIHGKGFVLKYNKKIVSSISN